MEAIILAGGKAERMGDAARGRPKALLEIGDRPLAAYQVGRLASAGVRRVIVSCALGQGELFEAELSAIGPEIAVAEEPERLGRGGGIKFAARLRRENGDVFALNGDELGDDDVVHGFREGGRIPYWVNCGIYVFSPETLSRLPEKGDHETTTFPELVQEGRLCAYRHEGLWLTVNTPKELRVASEQVAAHPEWLA